MKRLSLLSFLLIVVALATITPLSLASPSAGVVTQIPIDSSLLAALRQSFVSSHGGKMPIQTEGPIDGTVCYRIVTGAPAKPKAQPPSKRICSDFQVHAATYRGKSYAIGVFFSLRTFSQGAPERFARLKNRWVDLGPTKKLPVTGIPCLVLRSWSYNCPR
jgi:hypothetical protein